MVADVTETRNVIPSLEFKTRTKKSFKFVKKFFPQIYNSTKKIFGQ